MSDIQRWTNDAQLERMWEIIRERVYLAPETPNADMALALNQIQCEMNADHVAAVAAAREEGEVYATRILSVSNYQQGQRDERARIRAAVQALWRGPDGVWLTASEVLAVIDRESEPFEGYPPDSGTPTAWVEASDE